MNTCRFCNEIETSDRDLVQYGTRHYAHWNCYFEAGKKVADLNEWQRDRIPVWAMRNVAGVREQLNEMEAA